MRFTEQEILDRFQLARDAYKPLVTKNLRLFSSLSGNMQPDALAQFILDQDTGFDVLIEVVTLATPKKITQACWQIQEYLNDSRYQNRIPIILAPYIGPRQVKLLEEKQISWIDLSGNMLVRVPPRIYLERCGNKNQFPDSAPIKKIFQGTSSLVSRALLLQPKGFSSVEEIKTFIRQRNGFITAPTVSRVIKTLEEELLVRKQKTKIGVLDAEALLSRLTEGYKSINEQLKAKLKMYATNISVDELLQSEFFCGSNFIVRGFYAAQVKGFATTDKLTLYKDNIKWPPMDLVENSGGKIRRDDNFGQIEVIETKGSVAIFNSYQFPPTGPFIIDDLQLYLEMMCSTPRGPKIAEKLKPRILEGFSS